MEAQEWLCQHERRDAVDRDDVTLAGADCVAARIIELPELAGPPSLRNVRQINEAYFSHANY